MEVCDKQTKEIDKGDMVLTIFLDFKRAFEAIDKDLLFCKLNKIVLLGDTLKWFETYPSGKTQTVKFGNVVSNEVSIDYGVLQETVLEPLLFV